MHWHCDRRRLCNIQKPAPACVPVPTVFLRLTEWCLACGYGKGMHWHCDRCRLCNIQKPAPARAPVPTVFLRLTEWYLAVTGKGICTGTAIGVGCVIYKSQHPPVHLYPLCF